MLLMPDASLLFPTATPKSASIPLQPLGGIPQSPRHSPRLIIVSGYFKGWGMLVCISYLDENTPRGTHRAQSVEKLKWLIVVLVRVLTSLLNGTTG